MEPLEQGLFIAMEGLDGSGQSTQIRKLSEFLTGKGIPVKETKEPTNNLVGGLIRGQLSNEWKAGSECLQLLFAADRAHHIEKEIVPALEEGYVVLSDRYLFSSLAFGAQDMDVAWLEKINEPFRLPELSFYIDVSPAVCIERLEENRLGLELFEKREVLEDVAENYHRLIEEYDDFVAVDGERSVNEVHGSLLGELREFLSSSGKEHHRDLLERMS